MSRVIIANKCKHNCITREDNKVGYNNCSYAIPMYEHFSGKKIVEECPIDALRVTDTNGELRTTCLIKIDLDLASKEDLKKYLNVNEARYNDSLELIPLEELEKILIEKRGVNMVIEQINKEDVLATLCTGVSVYRLNVKEDKISNLKTKSINTIVNDLAKDKDYVYFTVKSEV